jgi:Rrf2 family protein
MHLSMSVEYAIHGLLFLAGNESNRGILLSEIARIIEVPESYLRKVFQILSRRGIVIAQRGAKGGYFLSRQPEQISVREVVEAIEGISSLYSCVSKGKKKCTTLTHCPIEITFKKAGEKMYEILEKISLNDLLTDFTKQGVKPVWLGAIA